MRQWVKGLIGITELVLVVVLSAVWADSIQNLALSSIVRTAIPALIGVGIGSSLILGSKSFKRRLVDDADAIKNHPYLTELQSFFDQDMYNLFGEQMHKDEILRLHNNLPGRLKLRSILLHPTRLEEMEDYEHAGMEEAARVPIPEPWVTYQETSMVDHMVDKLFSPPLRGLNISHREHLNHLASIENVVMKDLKELADIPWPVMTIEDDKFKYQASGGLERRS